MRRALLLLSFLQVMHCTYGQTSQELSIDTLTMMAQELSAVSESAADEAYADRRDYAGAGDELGRHGFRRAYE